MSTSQKLNESCPQCAGSGKIFDKEADINFDCIHCLGTGKVL